MKTRKGSLTNRCVKYVRGIGAINMLRVFYISCLPTFPVNLRLKKKHSFVQYLTHSIQPLL